MEAAAIFDLGAYEYLTFGGYNVSDDYPSRLRPGITKMAADGLAGSRGDLFAVPNRLYPFGIHTGTPVSQLLHP